jgi:ribosomal protein S18 acetylase RimI-like enzyme
MEWSDLSVAATISSKAFRTDQFFRYICPRLEDYPDDFRSFMLRLHKKRILQVGAVPYVAEIDETDPAGMRKVVGIAIWKRTGTTERARAWQEPNSGYMKSLERWLQYFEEAYSAVFIDRCADQKRVSEAYADIDNMLPEDIFDDYWQLQHLAIDPAFQRRGVGTLLTRWGVEQAREEGCCVALEASEDGKRMYERLGFQVIKTLPGDPSKGLSAAPVLVWQPEDSQEDWVGRAKARAEEEERRDAAM